MGVWIPILTHANTAATRLLPRGDARGRKRRFCSDKCRSAAHRERIQCEHEEQLAQARSQLSIDLGASTDIPREDLPEQLEEFAQQLEGLVFPDQYHVKVFDAAKKVLDHTGPKWWPTKAVQHINYLEELLRDLEKKVPSTLSTPHQQHPVVCVLTRHKHTPGRRASKDTPVAVGMYSLATTPRFPHLESLLATHDFHTCGQ